MSCHSIPSYHAILYATLEHNCRIIIIRFDGYFCKDAATSHVSFKQTIGLVKDEQPSQFQEGMIINAFFCFACKKLFV